MGFQFLPKSVILDDTEGLLCTLDATLVKTYTVRTPAFLPVIMWVSSFKNPRWTAKIQVFSKKRVH